MVIKAKNVQLCVYDWYKQDNGVMTIPPQNVAVGDILDEIVSDLKRRHGNSVPVDVMYCDLNRTENQLLYARMGATTVPVVAVAARYQNGEEVAYFLEQREKKPLKGIPFTREAIEPYVLAVLYKSYGQVSLFCKAVRKMGMPFLCNAEKWLYLAGAALAAANAYTTDNPKKQTLWAAGGAYCGYVFWKKGGLNDLQKMLKK